MWARCVGVAIIKLDDAEKFAPDARVSGDPCAACTWVTADVSVSKLAPTPGAVTIVLTGRTHLRQRFLAALALLAASAFALRAEDPQPAPAQGLDTLEKKVSYFLGHNVAAGYRHQGLVGLDADAFARGFKEELTGVACVMSDATIRELVQQYEHKLMAHQAQLKADAPKLRQAGAAFLEKNKAQEGVKVTASGLQYKVVKPGNGGAKPTPKDKVSVNYEGTLTDGTVFDSSYRKGAPVTFPVGGVIPGWQEGLQLMDVGATFMFYVPADLAYGDMGQGDLIHPGATLVFKVELLAINPKE